MKKYTTLICSVVIVAALALFVKSRWNAWFNNVPEPPYTASPIPDRITLTPGEQFMTQRTISWRCGDSIADAQVLLYDDNGNATPIAATGEVVDSRGGRDAFYHARLMHLNPGMQYGYRIVTAGDTSAMHTFAMPEAERAQRRFIFFGDVQDTIGGMSGEWFAQLYRRYGDVDFWACSGDLIERPIEPYWNYLYNSADSILASMPMLVATGNHDYIKSLYPTVDPRWRHTFVYPENGISMAEGLCYYIDMPDLRFIVLDTQGINDCISLASRYKWLRKSLKEAGDKWKVVMYHHPAYSVRESRNNLSIRNTFVPLLEKYGAHLVIQGHDHGYMRRTSTQGEHPVYIVSYMSPKSYKTREPEKGIKLIADTPMYHTVDYTASTMELRSYTIDGDSLVDQVTIARK